MSADYKIKITQFRLMKIQGSVCPAVLWVAAAHMLIAHELGSSMPFGFFHRQLVQVSCLIHPVSFAKNKMNITPEIICPSFLSIKGHAFLSML